MVAPDGAKAWSFPLSSDEPSPASLASLSREERERGQGFVQATKRNRFVSAKSCLRELLGRHLGTAPAELEIAYGEHGKPFLSDHPELSFNLSHSDEMGAVIIGDGRAVGIDIEDTARPRSFEAIALRFFADEERAWMTAGAPVESAERFYRIWTNKEAYVKALGVGLPLDSKHHALSLEVADTATLIRGEAQRRRPSPSGRTAHAVADDRWLFRTTLLPSGFMVSVCIAGDSGPT